MAQYIKDAKGKFAGSVGDGRDTVPSIPQTLRDAADAIDAGLMPAPNLKSVLAELSKDAPKEYTVFTHDGQDFPVTEEQADTLAALRSAGRHDWSDGIIEMKVMEDGFVRVVQYDPDPMSPREWDNTTIFTGLDRYLPDEAGLARSGDFVADVVAKYGDNVLLVPIYVYDHSGVSYSTGDPIRPGEPVPSGAEHGDRWDTSMAGFAIITEDNVRKMHGAADAKAWEQSVKNADGEVADYGRYVNGEVYRFTEYDLDGQWSDSVGGFYSTEEALDG